jgi:hypothetical protein
MGAASFCPGVRGNRYSGQLELAPNYLEKSQKKSALCRTDLVIFKEVLFA